MQIYMDGYIIGCCLVLQPTIAPNLKKKYVSAEAETALGKWGGRKQSRRRKLKQIYQVKINGKGGGYALFNKKWGLQPPFLKSGGPLPP